MGGYGSNQTAGNGISVGVIIVIVLGSLVLLALTGLLATCRTRARPIQPRTT